MELFGLPMALWSSRQVDRFHEGHDVDAVALQHGAVGEVELVHGEGLDPVLHGVVLAREEAGADAVGFVAEAQVQAGGLDLVVGDGVGGFEGAGVDQGDDGLGREDAFGLGVHFGGWVVRHFKCGGVVVLLAVVPGF